MKIAVVDDLLYEAESLHDILSAELEKKGLTDYHISLFSSGEEFLADYSAGTYDLIFLDIFMDKLSGVDVARHIRSVYDTVSIVFFTTSNEFAAQSYEVDAAYYLNKPIDKDKIASVLEKLNFSRMKNQRFIELPDSTRLLLSDIMYTEKFKHSLTFYLNRRESKSVTLNHAQAEELLNSYEEFNTVGQGTIINFEYVDSLSPDGFIMTDGTVIPIARRRLKEIKDIWTRYCFRKMSERDLL